MDVEEARDAADEIVDAIASDMDMCPQEPEMVVEILKTIIGQNLMIREQNEEVLEQLKKIRTSTDDTYHQRTGDHV